MLNRFASRARARRSLLALGSVVLLLLAAVPVLAGWATIVTNDGAVDSAWPATPLYSSTCSNGALANELEIKNGWIVNDGTDITFRIETCAIAASYTNIRMAAGIDCNNDGDVADPANNGPQGDRKAVQIVAQGATGDQVLLYDGANVQLISMPMGYSERIGANFEWKVGLQYLYPGCRASTSTVGIALATVEMTGTPKRPVTRDQTALFPWNIRMDYGDAINPNPQANPPTCEQYPTRTGCDGARHGLESTLRLGASVDPDGGDLHNTDANADDLNNQADEDGVTPAVGVNWVAGGSGAIAATVTGGSGVVNCWVDWNRNSSWGDSGEKVVNEAAAVTGLNTFTFSVPGSASFSSPYTARCRLAPAAGQAAAVTGAAEFGEAEDHAWVFGSAGNRPAPLALSISLAPTAHDVQLSWAPAPSNESYLILSSPRPYFQPGDADVTTKTDANNASPHPEPGVAGVPGAPVSLYYAARGQVTSSTPDLLSPLSNRVGLFEFGLVKGGS